MTWRTFKLKVLNEPSEYFEMNCNLQTFYQKSIFNSFSQIHTKFQLIRLSSFKLHLKNYCHQGKFWNEFNITKSKVGMCEIPKFMKWMVSNLISMAKIVFRLNLWNQNWVLVLIILKLSRYLRIIERILKTLIKNVLSL